jgi:hypothetical protein
VGDAALALVFLWAGGAVILTPAFHMLARYGRGSFEARLAKARWRTVLWPLALVMLFLQVCLLAGGKAAGGINGWLSGLATAPRDIRAREMAGHEERLAQLTAEADEAENASVAMDEDLSLQQSIGKLRSTLEIAQERSRPDGWARGGKWLDPDTRIRLSAITFVELKDLEHDSLVWHDPETDTWRKVVTFGKVPAGAMLWQVDKHQKTRRIRIAEYGYWTPAR